jgi:hypothetical protein
VYIFGRLLQSLLGVGSFQVHIVKKLSPIFFVSKLSPLGSLLALTALRTVLLEIRDLSFLRLGGANVVSR